MISLVVSPQELEEEEVVVEGRAHRHLFRSRRLGIEAEVRLVDGLGHARFSRVVAITHSSARLKLGSKAPENEPARRVELLTPIPKPSRLAWLVEKTTELGVSAIRLIQSERGPRRSGASQLDRLQRIAVSAVEQSQRSIVPEISGPHRFAEMADLLQPVTERWALHPAEPAFGLRVGPGDAALIVGPEGGWTTEELATLATFDCRRAGLGPTVLRMETAAIVGCAGLLLGAGIR